MSACHQDIEIPAQALHEQVFFVLEFRVQAGFAHTCGPLKVLNTRLSEAMLPEDGDRFVEDIFSCEQFPSSHCNIIGQFTRGLANKGPNGPLFERMNLSLEDPCPLAVNNRSSIS